MLSVQQILRLLRESAQNLKSPPPRWCFSFMTFDHDDLELANTQKSARLNQETLVIEQVEDYFANWNQCQYAYSFFNARSALDAIIEAYGWGEGDEVILSPYACVVVYNAFVYRKVKVVFADIEPDTLSLDADQVSQKINPATKAVILPHIMGYVASHLKPIKEICQKRGLVLIEDCAQSLGAKLEGQKVGNFGDAAIYSFERSKIITSVVGGMVSTNQAALASKLAAIQSSASFPPIETTRQIMETANGLYYKFKSPNWAIRRPWVRTLKEPHFLPSTYPGELQQEKPPFYGFRMDSLTAQLLFYQLQKLHLVLRDRIKQAREWQQILEKHKQVQFLQALENAATVYCRFPFRVPAQEKATGKWDVYGAYKTGKWYSTLLDPADIAIDDMPVATQACKEMVNLPTILS